MIDKLDAAAHRLKQLINTDAEMAEPEEQELLQLIETHYPENSFFSPYALRAALQAFGENLATERLSFYFSTVITQSVPKHRKTLALVSGSNPLSGFTDLVRAILLEYPLVLRLPPENKRLLPAVKNFLELYIPQIADWVNFTEGYTKEPDVIFTHELDADKHDMLKYFGQYNGVVREKRKSVVVMTGDEDEMALKLLADGVLAYFGQYSHNITKIYIPDDYRPDDLLNSFDDWSFLKDHNKYRNNYDYYKSVYLLNRENFFDNEIVLLKEAPDEIISPLGVIYFEKYSDNENLEHRLAAPEIARVYRSKTSYPDFWHPDLFALEDNARFLKAMGVH